MDELPHGAEETKKTLKTKKIADSSLPGMLGVGEVSLVWDRG